MPHGMQVGLTRAAHDVADTLANSGVGAMPADWRPVRGDSANGPKAITLEA